MGNHRTPRPALWTREISGWARVDPPDQRPFRTYQEMHHHLRDDRLLPLRYARRREPRPIRIPRRSSRRFLVLVGLYVCKVPALLARWRCPDCRKTFTDYPSFACPHKAYTLPQMTERAAGYVNNTATSYRKGVCSGNLPIFYAQGPANTPVQHCYSDAILSRITMAHSSLFHWVTALSRDALRQPEPPHTDFAPAPSKYASERRRSILIACRATCSHLLLGQRPIAQPCG